MPKTYDLVIIGSGTAAQAASARVRAAGWEVAVVDHRTFGGTCALRGCDPKKMLISGAEAIDAASRMRMHGVSGELRIDWRELMAFKRSFTDPVPHKQEQRYAAKGIDAFHGLARFTGPDAIAVDGRQLKARRKADVDTAMAGSRPDFSGRSQAIHENPGVDGSAPQAGQGCSPWKVKPTVLCRPPGAD